MQLHNHLFQPSRLQGLSSSGGDIFIADGRRIRKVDRKGLIHTLAGGSGSAWASSLSGCKWQEPAINTQVPKALEDFENVFVNKLYVLLLPI